MITRPEFAEFIRKIADGDVVGYNWDRYAVAHFSDKTMESVRVRLVRASIADTPMDSTSLLGLARELEGPDLPDIFFCGSLVVGQFTDGYPSEKSEVKYEPFRGPGHSYLQEQLSSHDEVACHFVRVDERYEFSVFSCPRYGVLSIGGPTKTGEQDAALKSQGIE